MRKPTSEAAKAAVKRIVVAAVKRAAETVVWP